VTRSGAVETERAKPAWLHAAALLLVTLYVLFVDLDATPYDDSFFFKRFALHFLEHGGFSWNVADGPVYGLTSQLFGVLAVPLTWLFPGHFVLGSKLFLAASLLALGAVLLRVAARSRVAAADAGLLVNAIALESLTPVLIHLNRTYKSQGAGIVFTDLSVEGKT